MFSTAFWTACPLHSRLQNWLRSWKKITMKRSIYYILTQTEKKIIFLVWMKILPMGPFGVIFINGLLQHSVIHFHPFQSSLANTVFRSRTATTACRRTNRLSQNKNLRNEISQWTLLISVFYNLIFINIIKVDFCR